MENHHSLRFYNKHLDVIDVLARKQKINVLVISTDMKFIKILM